jgi:hypothetical protein
VLEKVKQFKEVTLDYDAVNGATLTVYTDLPGGGATSLRRTISLPSSTGRRTYTAALDKTSDGGILEGTLIRFKITSSGIVRLFGGTLRLRHLGVYFDGSQGEVWESQDLSFVG